MHVDRVDLGLLLAASLVVATADPARSQLRDHLQCHRVRDPIPLQGVVDVSSRFGVHGGCRLSRAKLYCEPAVKTVQSSNRPVLPVGGRGLLDSRVCYRLRCSSNAAFGFGGATDQFGQHLSVGLPRPRLLCVPAVYGPPATPMDNLDDLLCYRARESSFDLRGVVDADTRNLGIEAGCRIGHSRFFCAAAQTTIQTVNVGPLLPIGGVGEDDDRVCYRVDCPRPHPGPQVVSDRFGSRTDTNLTPKLMCTPIPAPTTSTTTTMTTSTTTTLPPGTDPALFCQRAIEGGGMTFALAWLNRIEQCAGPPALVTVANCSETLQMNDIRNQWRADAEAACTGVDLRTDLGYADSCTACTAAQVDSLIGNLASQIATHVVNAARMLYADSDPATACHDTLGNGALGVLRSALLDLNSCAWQPGATRISACFAPDATTWRSQAETACAGVDPFVSLGYRTICNLYNAPPVFPGACAANAYPCTFRNTAVAYAAGPDDDLLDCLSCQLGEAVLGIGRDLFGANLCCIGGTCNRVLTRFACFEAGGTPVRYRMSSLPGVSTGGAHGIDVGPDGALYMTGPGNVITRVALPGGAQTTVGTTAFFPTGVAVDAIGNIYVTNRCQHTVSRIPPGGGAATVIAGTGVPGYSGDGGPAVAAMIHAPDGIAVDPAGNVYFTHSGLLGFACGSGTIGDERVRMIDTSGMIHTIAGGGSGPEGGLALGAGLVIPYGLRRAPGGSLLVGEVGAQRVLRITGGLLLRVAGLPIGAAGHYGWYGGPAAEARFYQNCGIAEDPDGNVVIGPMEDNRIALADSLGSVIGIAGTGQGSTFGGNSGDGLPALLAQAGCPEDVAIGPDGKIYFSDLQTQRIRVLTREPF